MELSLYRFKEVLLLNLREVLQAEFNRHLTAPSHPRRFAALVYDGNNLGHQKLLEQHTLRFRVVPFRARLRRRAEAPVNGRAKMNKL